MIAFEAELANANAAHARLDDISTRSEADTTKARSDLENYIVCLGKVEQSSKSANVYLDDTRKQSLKSAKTAEVLLRQLTEMSSRDQLFEGEVDFLTLQMSKFTKKRNDATILATEQSRKLRMLEACIILLENELNSLKQKE